MHCVRTNCVQCAEFFLLTKKKARSFDPSETTSHQSHQSGDIQETSMASVASREAVSDITSHRQVFQLLDHFYDLNHEP